MIDENDDDDVPYVYQDPTEDGQFFDSISAQIEFDYLHERERWMGW